MQRRGSIALVTVAISALACGQTAMPTGSTTTAPVTSPSAPVAPIPPPTNEPAMSPAESESPERASWKAAASMPRERQGFDAVLVGDGSVLVVGSDWDCQPGPAMPGSETAVAYDPVGDTWSAVESLNKPRKNPATVRLPDGRALVVGGVNSDDVPFSSTKIFDPATRAWSDGPLLEYARGRASAVALDDGRVLVVSADGPDDFVSTTELSDKQLARWSLVRSLPAHIDVLELVGLRDGRALAIGIDGRGSDPRPAALVYDAGENTWTTVEGLARVWATYLSLPDGSVLAIGGSGGGELWGDTRTVIADVARFDPWAGGWLSVGPMMTPRYGLQATALANGQVLVAGGTSERASGEQVSLRSTELYDPASDVWTSAGALREPRYGGRLIALDDGSALVLGGAADYNVYGDAPFCPVPLTTVERFRP